MASLTIPLLTEKDQEVLRAFLDRIRHLQPVAGNADAAQEDYMAPEVYVARTPTDGIAGMAEEAGTGSLELNDQPGSALCTIYRLVFVSGVAELRPVTGLQKRVYNLSPVGIPGDVWIVVARDKFGQWFVVEEPGGDAGYYAKVVNGTPDSDGYFDATFMVKLAAGTLLDTGAQVYLRDANNAPLLHRNEIHHAHLTGTHNGRKVFTTADFNLILEEGAVDNVGTGYGELTRTHRLRFFPDTDWEITRPSGTTNQRTTQVRYIGTSSLTVREEGDAGYAPVTIITLSTAAAWTLTNPDVGEVLVVRNFDVYEGNAHRGQNVWKLTFADDDFDLTDNITGTAAGQQGDQITVFTQGVTENIDVLTRCVAGVLKKRTLSFVRGLLDAVSAEVDA